MKKDTFSAYETAQLDRIVTLLSRAAGGRRMDRALVEQKLLELFTQSGSPMTEAKKLQSGKSCRRKMRPIRSSETASVGWQAQMTHLNWRVATVIWAQGLVHRYDHAGRRDGEDWEGKSSHRSARSCGRRSRPRNKLRSAPWRSTLPTIMVR